RPARVARGFRHTRMSAGGRCEAACWRCRRSRQRDGNDRRSASRASGGYGCGSRGAKCDRARRPDGDDRVSADRPTDDSKAFRGRGWAMPVALDPRTGLVASVAYEEDIRQSILIILETAPGERVMRPNFGCGIHEMVFTAVDSTALQRIRSTVEEALRRCEARIDVLGVDIDEAATLDGQLLVEIEYRVRQTNQLGNLVFPSYFREGGRP